VTAGRKKLSIMVGGEMKKSFLLFLPAAQLVAA